MSSRLTRVTTDPFIIPNSKINNVVVAWGEGCLPSSWTLVELFFYAVPILMMREKENIDR